MKRASRAILAGGIVCLALAANIGVAAQPPSSASGRPEPVDRRGSPAPVRPAPVSSHATKPSPPLDLNAVVRRYCVTCHNETRKTGGLSLATFDVADAGRNADVTEKMIRKLQAGLMPPPAAARPDAAAHAALIAALETNVDAASLANPNPGIRTFQRLNRPEYARAIRDLLALDVNAGSWLPLDQKSANFDNIADAQALSPTLLEAYLNAAAAISSMAFGDRNAPAVDHGRGFLDSLQE